MSDSKTSVAELRETVRQFVAQRQWEPFHSPKNLSMALAIEAAEMMEHFQWITADDSRAIGQDREKLEAVCEEMADVLCYVLAMAKGPRKNNLIKLILLHKWISEIFPHARCGTDRTDSREV